MLRIIILSLSLIILTGCQLKADNIAPVEEVKADLADIDRLVIPENLLLNSDLDLVGNKINKAQNWSDFGSGYARVISASGTNWMIRVESQKKDGQAGARQEIVLNQKEMKPVFIGANVWGEAIMNSPDGYFGASLYIEAHLADGTVVYENSVANYGTFEKRWIGINTGSLDEITGPIERIYIMPVIINATGVAYFDDLQTYELVGNSGAVTLMFDDGKRSTWDDIRPIMNKYRFPGVVAAISSKVDTEGYMNWNELGKLEKAGWEIMSHSVSHKKLTTFDESKSLKEIFESKRSLTRRGLNIKSFVYPFGDFNGLTNGQVQPYYRSARSYSDGINPIGVYPYQVEIKSIYDTTTAGDLQKWLNNANEGKKWLVLVFHIVAETGADKYHISSSEFVNMLESVVDSGLPVITYDQGIDMFAVGESI